MYFGSVRFFRHLIICVLLLLLVVPIIGAAMMGVQYVRMRQELAEATAIIGSYAQAQDELKSEFESLSESVRSQISLLQPQINVAINDQMSQFKNQLDSIIQEQAQTQEALGAILGSYKQQSGGRSGK